ncbi:uncharacterized protein LOC100374783 [Saccoglossus kowalevskii]|uniref:Uncharacterized protein LOC100374783 n=1 Tax=Saccoglossus kowalevskii TaxID=10224 RepID=A0ABM0GTZ3_SACKO|nr:PREDICTED: uncharacterized protein LOC100374783 [Saccoglossus kowalevskii]
MIPTLVFLWMEGMICLFVSIFLVAAGTRADLTPKRPLRLAPDNVVYTATLNRPFTMAVSMAVDRLRRTDDIIVGVEDADSVLIRRYSDRDDKESCTPSNCVFVHRSRKHVTVEFQLLNVKEPDLGPRRIDILIKPRMKRRNMTHGIGHFTLQTNETEKKRSCL